MFASPPQRVDDFEMDQALTEMATLGLPIHITELDVNSAQGGQRSTGADIANNAATTQGGLVSDADRRLADAYAGLFPGVPEARQTREDGHVLGPE